MDKEIHAPRDKLQIVKGGFSVQIGLLACSSGCTCERRTPFHDSNLFTIDTSLVPQFGRGNEVSHVVTLGPSPAFSRPCGQARIPVLLALSMQNMAKTVRTFQDAQTGDKSICTSSVYVALRSPFSCSNHPFLYPCVMPFLVILIALFLAIVDRASAICWPLRDISSF
jgi:hypothetical protein